MPSGWARSVYAFGTAGARVGNEQPPRTIEMPANAASKYRIKQLSPCANPQLEAKNVEALACGPAEIRSASGRSLASWLVRRWRPRRLLGNTGRRREHICRRHRRHAIGRSQDGIGPRGRAIVSLVATAGLCHGPICRDDRQSHDESACQEDRRQPAVCGSSRTSCRRLAVRWQRSHSPVQVRGTGQCKASAGR